MKLIITKISIIVCLTLIFFLGTGFQIERPLERDNTLLSVEKKDTTKTRELNGEGFNWLVGDWRFDDGKAVTYESWKEMDTNYYEGHSFIIKKGQKDTTFSEFMKVIKFGKEWYFLAKFPSRKLPVSFKLVYLRNYRAVFQNVENDFPQQIMYENNINFNLQATIEGNDKKTGEPKKYIFTFQRIK